MNFKKKYYFIFLLLILFFYFLYHHTQPAFNNISTSYLKVHYIDVDQGDAILVQVNNKSLLIDSGSKESEEKFFTYLNNIKVSNFDYVIATHPHEDHIGNMAKLIKNYNVANFYAPKIVHTSKAFETMIDALISKNKSINVIKSGINSIDLGDDTIVTVLSPTQTTNSDNYNEYSAVIKIQFKDTSFIFTGDAESVNEYDILQHGDDINANVIKIGHHGSSTSTSKAFLNSINPSLAVISVGANNTYNHPNTQILDLLKESNVKVFRTDLNGTILITSDGKSLYVTTESSSK